MVATAVVIAFVVGLAAGIAGMYLLFSRAEEGISNLQKEHRERRQYS
jgi:hypothetical protein